MIEIYDKYNRPPSFKEKGGGKRVTESAGYIPTHIQIAQFRLAGQRLGEWRREKFDYGPGEKLPEELITDPFRDRGLDMAEATAIENYTKARITKQAEDAKKAKLEAEKEVDKPEVKSDGMA